MNILVSYLRYFKSIQGMDLTIAGARSYLKTLTPDALFVILGKNELKDKNVTYDELKDILDELVWRHGPHWMIHQYLPPEVSEEIKMDVEKTKYFRVIGDVHGKYDKYCSLVSQAEYSVQVGDMGFDYDYITQKVNPAKHRVVGGNHDNYTKHFCENCLKCEGKGYFYGDQSGHFLGDYGVWHPPEFMPIFYLRGAWSIDQKYRMPGISWWEDEEIPYGQMMKAFDFYKKVKPDFVISHTCPFSVVNSIPFERIFGDKIHKPRTEEFLDQMYDEWQPKIHIFGHWHCDFAKSLEHPKTGKKTLFVCLNELSSLDFPKNFQITENFTPQIQVFNASDIYRI